MAYATPGQPNDGILATIGNTPLVRLSRLTKGLDINIFAKLELFNPGGSLKDRPALKMLKAALDKGEIDSETTIIESSSGNLGIGLAQVCAYLGLQFICVTDVRSTLVSRRIIKAYGARLDLIEEPDPEIGTLLAARIKYVRHLRETVPNNFNCDQYTNLNNPRAHYETMQEIVEALDCQPDYLFCAVSTCGTLRGCSEYIVEHNLDTKIMAVDAKGSVIFGYPSECRLIPGHGAGIVPPLYYANLETTHILVSDLDCVVGCRQLAQREAIFAGGSAGGIMTAILKMQPEIPAGSTCVAILGDQGGRYIETIYNDDWVKEHFGEVSHLWLEN